MFYGIIVSIFYEDNERHHLPHIHVRYQGMNFRDTLRNCRSVERMRFGVGPC